MRPPTKAGGEKMWGVAAGISSIWEKNWMPDEDAGFFQRVRRGEGGVTVAGPIFYWRGKKMPLTPTEGTA